MLAIHGYISLPLSSQGSDFSEAHRFMCPLEQKSRRSLHHTIKMPNCTNTLYKAKALPQMPESVSAIEKLQINRFDTKKHSRFSQGGFCPIHAGLVKCDPRPKGAKGCCCCCCCCCCC